MVAPLVGLVVFIAVTILGPTVDGVDLQQIGALLTAFLVGLVTVLHGPTLARKVKAGARA